MKIFSKTCMLIVLLCSVFGNAQTPGSVDLTFNPTLAGVASIYSTYSCNHKVASDGKIIVTGEFSTYNGVTKNGIARLNADGTLDNTFLSGTGFLTTNGNISRVSDIEFQPDGKILLVGNFSRYNGVNKSHMIRLNTNGTLDTTFNAGTGGVDGATNGWPSKILLLPNGEIILGGTQRHWNGAATSGIIKINSTGGLIPSFTTNTGNGPNGFISDMRLQSDGRVLVSGNFLLFHSATSKGLVVINQDGSTYDLFATAGFQLTTGSWTGAINAAYRDASNKILIMGSFRIGGVVNVLARLNSNGTIDNTFNFPLTTSPTGLYKVPGVDKYMIPMESPGLKKLYRILNDGSLDSSFTDDSNLSILGGAAPMELSFIANDQMIISGRFNVNYSGTTKVNIARLNGGNCADNLVITADVTTGIDKKEAGSTIIASNTINSGAGAIYHAGNSVTFVPPFHVKSGATLHAYIEGCTGNYLAKEAQMVEELSMNNEPVSEISKIAEKEIVTILPNPNNGIFKIVMNNLSEGEMEISNLYGASVFKREFKNTNELEINMQEQPKGIYIVKIFSNNQLYITKIIKN